MSRSDDRNDASRGTDRTGQDTEMMEFGRGSGRSASGAPSQASPPSADDAPRPADRDVDAWYTDPEHETETRGPSWLASRWSSWTALDRDRRTIIVLIAVAILAVIAALVGVAGRHDQTAVELPAVESHGLDPDEAACFAYGLIEKRFNARLAVDGFDSTESDSVTGLVNQEVQQLDDLAASHPEADYQLIAAFAALADAGSMVVDSDAFAEYQTAVAKRSAAAKAAAAACDDIAGFDVDALEPN